MSADTIRVEREHTLGEATIRTVVEVPAHMRDVAKFVESLMRDLEKKEDATNASPAAVNFQFEITHPATAAEVESALAKVRKALIEEINKPGTSALKTRGPYSNADPRR